MKVGLAFVVVDFAAVVVAALAAAGAVVVKSTASQNSKVDDVFFSFMSCVQSV